MKKKKVLKISHLIVMWAVIVVLIVIAAIIPIAIQEDINFTLMEVVVSLASFIATSFFSILIYNHNLTMREQNEEIRRQTKAEAKRGELFRNLQFMAGNYSIIDFVDHMLMYDEFDRYTKRLIESNDFSFYLLEQNLEKENVVSDVNNFKFITVRIPIQLIEGKVINKVTIHKMKFVKDTETYIFSPGEGIPANALIIYNTNDQRFESIINLVMKKESDFYKDGEINLYKNIKITLSMESVLNVVVTGVIELYFTNPEKIEKSGASKYKINSSQIQLIGRPRLDISSADADEK